MKKALVLLIAVFLSGCSSLDKASINDPSKHRELEALTVIPSYDVFLVRTDLIRSTHTETRTTTVNGQTQTTTVTVPDPYHYLCVNFGNGIFIDRNDNIYIDIMEFYGMDKNAFNITHQMNSFGKPEVYYKKAGNVFTREGKGLFSNKTTADISGNNVAIDEGFFGGGKAVITVTENEIVCDPKGILKWGKSKILKTGDSSVLFPVFGKDLEIRKDDSGNVIVGEDNLKIESSGKQLKFIFRGLFKKEIIHYFIRTETGFVFYDEKFRGVEVSKNGNQISVYLNNKLTEKFIIN